MTVEVKKSVTRSEVDKELGRLLKKKRKLNLRKFMGKVRFAGINAIEYQKKLRDEWA
jgi:hypothetical protein